MNMLDDIAADLLRTKEAEKPTDYSSMKLLIWKDSLPVSEVMELRSKSFLHNVKPL